MPTHEMHVYLPEGSSEAEVTIGPTADEEFMERAIARVSRDGRSVTVTTFVHKSGVLPDIASGR